MTDVLYSFRIPYPAYYARGKANLARLEVYRNGLIVSLATGSRYSLWPPDEDLDTGTPIVSPAAPLVASDGAAEYTVSAGSLPSTLAYGRGYQEVWSCILPDSTTREIRRPVALVRRPLHPVVVDDDIDPRGSLAIHRPRTLTTWQTYLDQAWRKILHRLEQLDRWPELLWNPGDSFELHLSMTRCEIYEEFSRSQGGKWIELLAEERKNAMHLWATWSAKLDTSQSGHPDSQDQVGMGIGTVFAGRPGSTRYSFGGL